MKNKKKTKRAVSRGFRPTPENEWLLSVVSAKGITVTWAINEALRIALPSIAKGNQ